ncbi:hypothetical protein CCHL11_09056 [Colletotrichum chlorophyti]|uniref:Rhodopsin domain-containing protein n=1 Tax=Colletotrichum chlorophyti TaxID=708187 RepID=A0A1Q8RAU4_9PEZI|nr:hypothetical protein CCHL11_09056 [Colletotrichum chlorophyti]
MRIPPLEVILSWPPPRYDDPETRGPANEIVVIILLAIATVIIAIRIYTRKQITHGFGWDDILVVLAYFPATGFVVLGMIAQSRFGWGRHIWDVPLEQLTGSIQLGLASQILFDLATSFTKLSMLALMYRIARAASNNMRLLVIGLQVFISINCVLFMFVVMLQCRPLSLYWTLSAEPQNCINEAVHLLIASIINTVTDFAVVILPLALVRIVYIDKLSSRQMLIVNLLFGAGFIASFAGAARTYFTWIMTTEPDKTWHAWMNWLMSCIELFLGIICTSTPSTKPFFNRYIPKILSSTPRKSRATSAPLPANKGTSGSMIGSGMSVDSESKELKALPAGPQFSTPEVGTPSNGKVLNQPLPAVMKKDSIYIIKIQLDETSLTPADRTRPRGNRILDQSDLAEARATHNFSRPKAAQRVVSISKPPGHARQSIQDRRESRRHSRSTSTSTAGASSRYSQILDIENDYRQSFDNPEAGAYSGPQETYSHYAPPTRKHAKSGSVGTFGGLD